MKRWLGFWTCKFLQSRTASPILTRAVTEFYSLSSEQKKFSAGAINKARNSFLY